jgi:hypothetical protein
MKEITNIIELPIGVKISENKYGKCLIATKEFNCGDIIWKEIPFIDNINKEFKFFVYNDNKIDTYIITPKNTVNYNSNRIIYTWSGFTNHSCDPNSFSKNYSDIEYEQIAIKKINIGDEITCNYLLFDYDCNGHIFECYCNSKNCFGLINGFKNLSIDNKLKLIDFVDICIYDKWVKDDNIIHIKNDFQLPDFIKIVNENNYKKIISMKSFYKDEIIYKINLLKITNQIIIYNNDLIDIKKYTLKRNDYRLFFYFDSFMNHSCDPNCYNIYENNEETYILKAKKDILIGQELTIDYTLDDYLNDDIPFNCNCNYIYCKKFI